ncbi:uncharacterized protein SCHCODRAFT_02624227 [Schizophyllum commune H4-8]|nr:uncharacterized protein SCHCODRAFT_02624227 [Schizophyllum commune H4-8]KAI5894273.1 hypothetical protein SCHCODRAFT_02624227 [Schizophyllum commune H4-8]
MLSDSESDTSERSSQWDSPESVFPINNLPTELLGTIFVHVCEDEPLVLPIPFSLYEDPPCPALVISWVCRDWRFIALSTHEIWAPPIILDLQQIDQAEDDEVIGGRSISILLHYLENSAALPLPRVDVLSVWNLAKTSAAHSPIRLLGMIVQAIARWKSCALHGVVAHILCQLPHVPDSDLLERLEVTTYARGDLDSDYFVRAPRLHSYTGPLAPLPWARLRDVEITEFSTWAIISQVLTASSLLVNLRVHLRHDPLFSGVATLTLPHLEETTFVIGSPEILGHIFGSLITPNMRSLELGGVDNPGPDALPGSVRRKLEMESWPLVEFADWLDRSKCSLDALALHTIAMPRAHVTSILECLPSLTSFSIDEDYRQIPAGAASTYSSIDDDLLCRLTAMNETAPSLLPRLKKLSIKGVLRFSHTMLVDMVKSRLPSGLEYLDIFGGLYSKPEDVDEDTRAQLRLAMGDQCFMQFDVRSSTQWMDFEFLDSDRFDTILQTLGVLPPA